MLRSSSQCFRCWTYIRDFLIRRPINTARFVGPRNAERFPRFTSFDLQMTRPIAIPVAKERLKARIGFSVFNLFNRFNPRDVQSDVDSYRFGALYNGVGRTFRGKFVLEF